MRRTALALLAALAALPAASGEDLAAEARKQHEAAQPLWEMFVLDPAKTTDDELKALLAIYDKTLDLCLKAAEKQDDKGLDTMVLQLARRTATLRATLLDRELAAKGGTPAAPQPAAPVEGEAEIVLPTLDESADRRAQGKQDVRNFLMDYFRNRKRETLIVQCATCHGLAKRQSQRVGDFAAPRQSWYPCETCGGDGCFLNGPAAKQAFWLCWSPLYRLDEKERTAWEATFAKWRKDPKGGGEFLTRLKIGKVEYYGLWAQATWEEWGITPDGKKTHREVTRRLVRGGRRWFFFHPDHDRDFFAKEKGS